MSAYYNENDPNAAAWLRELIKAGAIAPGEVDGRDIRDIRPGELAGYTQCHFFAGIGGWAEALRLAGWPDDQPVWTGSCPCQPFSAAGKGAGFTDERHLWPAWFHLIEECCPDDIFGEQVASPAGLEWFDLVRADMEGAGYACGPVDVCAAGVGAPHIRQRNWWVAHADGWDARAKRLQRGWKQRLLKANRGAVWLGDSSGARGGRHSREILGAQSGLERSVRSVVDILELAGPASELGHADDEGSQGRRVGRYSADQLPVGAASVARFWSGADWIYCTDEKYRPVEPGTFPLAHGLPARVGRLRGYGNAIVPEVAAEIIRAALS
jgi:DNA (cytosine-5)-methyltransferase 1